MSASNAVYGSTATLKKIENRKITTASGSQAVDERARDEEQRRERNSDQDERSASANGRPDAIRKRANRRLNNRAFDTARTRQQTDEQIRRAKRFQNGRQNKVVERVERARADRPGRIHRCQARRRCASLRHVDVFGHAEAIVVERLEESQPLACTELSGRVGRRRPDSNRRWRFCRPLPCHLATSPWRREIVTATMGGMAGRGPGFV